jgi:hypothetical protein
MEQASTPFRKSWGLYFQVLVILWIVGLAMAVGGYYMVGTTETVIVVLGWACLIAGPLIVVVAPFLPRPASGACPSCGHRIYRMLASGSEAFLLCPCCAAYSMSSQDRLIPAPINAVSDEPTFAAALRWDDIAGEKGQTVAFSKDDFLMDKLNDIIARKEAVRVIDKWPPGCCICGESATRRADHAVTVLLKGRARETQTIIAARGVPYCNQHEKGVAFGTVDFAVHLLNNPSVFGIKFRSHAFREAFRKLNPSKFETQI